MSYVIIIALSILLLVSFLILVAFEQRKGIRIAGNVRSRLDEQVARLGYIYARVDWGQFSAHVMRTTLEAIAHEIAHKTLLAVRAIERFLTSVVRGLRERREGIMTPATERPSRLQSMNSFARKTFHRTKKIPDEEEVAKEG